MNQTGNFAGKTVLLTGAASGIGRAAAHGFAQGGARLWLTGRNVAAGQALVVELMAQHRRSAAEIRFVAADLTRLVEVQALAQQVALDLAQDNLGLDVLANNAGLYCEQESLTTDGYDTTFQVNHLAPFLLTRLLLSHLLVAKGRVITTSSGLHKYAPLNVAALAHPQPYKGYLAYGQSKLANILFTQELARRYGAQGLHAYSFHPGLVHTGIWHKVQGGKGILMRMLSPLFRSPVQGADTLLYLAGASGLEAHNGGYFHDRRPKAPKHTDPHTALALWQASETLLKISGDKS